MAVEALTVAAGAAREATGAALDGAGDEAPPPCPVHPVAMTRSVVKTRHRKPVSP